MCRILENTWCCQTHVVGQTVVFNTWYWTPHGVENTHQHAVFGKYTALEKKHDVGKNTWCWKVHDVHKQIVLESTWCWKSHGVRNRPQFVATRPQFVATHSYHFHAVLDARKHCGDQNMTNTFVTNRVPQPSLSYVLFFIFIFFHAIYCLRPSCSVPS